jgi:hypothetical protein
VIKDAGLDRYVNLLDIHYSLVSGGGGDTDCRIEKAVLLPLELLHNLVMDCLPRISLCGNLFTNALPGNVSTRHNMYTFLWVMLQSCQYQIVTVPNDRMTGERLIGKVMEESSHGPIEIIS